ncbi:MAG TPA: class I SAM-dependent methyltransferase [Solirubrobacteraceae bacterium]|nr:class I SAM-dependent methyltransferase [Solirubrobacteraceae bacterium]
MSLWGRVFAAGYDRLLDGAERAGLREQRRRLLGAAAGRVIEVGAGTGLNLALYPDAVSELILTEPEEPMAKRLERRLISVGRNAEVVRAPAERLPFADDSFDYAVSTLVLCTVSDPDRALAELRRVLKPDGRLLFIEHVRAQAAGTARWQDRLHPLWLRIGHGCHCNRSTLEAIEAAHFQRADVEHTQMPKAPFFLRPMIVGSAKA